MSVINSLPWTVINLMPNIGIRYNTYKDNAYTETGTGVNNIMSLVSPVT